METTTINHNLCNVQTKQKLFNNIFHNIFFNIYKNHEDKKCYTTIIIGKKHKTISRVVMSSPYQTSHGEVVAGVVNQ